MSPQDRFERIVGSLMRAPGLEPSPVQFSNGSRTMKLFEWKGAMPNDGVVLGPQTNHGAPTHAVCIRCGAGGGLEITYFTGRGPVKERVKGVPAVIVVADPERLRLGEGPRSAATTPG